MDEAPPGGVWVHAVSVGEVLSAVPFVRALREALPEAPVFVSTTTLAGRAAAEDKLRGLADAVFFAPIDYALPVRRVLRRLRPRAVVVLETEIWPNLWREARRFGCALIVVNGRISDRALPRYRRWRWFFAHVLELPDALLVQSERDRARYLELGAPAPRAIGNLKYDFRPAGAPAPAIGEFIARLRPERVWIAASTMPPDEEETVLAAFREAASPGLLLILAPRRPERFEAAAELLRRSGTPFARRSELPRELPLPGVLLLDTIGELSALFGVADVVFMGGTLAPRGGHNILEPACYGKPVIAGPHMENFAEIAERFTAAGALVRIAGAGELGAAVSRLLGDAEERRRVGDRARALAEAERGAAARAVAEVVERYRDAVPRRVPPLAWVLRPLTWLWRAGVAIDARHKPVRLNTPVISVGGLAAGGSGKTPVVLWLAQQLERPAILTRGYRRRSREPMIAAGAAPADQTGDEAQLYLRAGVTPVGIGADRFAVGREIEARYKPAVFILDDGFQHRRLHRDFDLLVLDGLDPFGGGALLPLGRLREPVEAARRAHAVVVTRVVHAGGVERALRAAGYGGPIFTARMSPQGWYDAGTNQPSEVPPRAGAFCGLGNPGSFWQSLRALGIAPVFRRAFPDHHKYTAAELDAMLEDADALLTTEKDIANLPAGWRGRVLWLKIALEIDRGDELLELIGARLKA